MSKPRVCPLCAANVKGHGNKVYCDSCNQSERQRLRYANDPAFRQNRIEQSRQRYANNPEAVKRYAEHQRQRYAEKIKERPPRMCPDCGAEVKGHRNKICCPPCARQRKYEYHRRWRANNSEYRQRQAERCRQWYAKRKAAAAAN